MHFQFILWPRTDTARFRLSFVASRLDKDWALCVSGLVSVEDRPVEATPALCHAMRDVFLAQAQALTVAHVSPAHQTYCCSFIVDLFGPFWLWFNGRDYLKEPKPQYFVSFPWVCVFG